MYEFIDEMPEQLQSCLPERVADESVHTSYVVNADATEVDDIDGDRDTGDALLH